MPHAHPSSDELASFSAFFKRAVLNRDGSADVVFNLPKEAVGDVVDLSSGNDGMALNITVWGTELDEEGAGLAGLLELLGGAGDD